MTEENIHFYTLNVRQGDSHVIHFPAHEAAIVIDPYNAGVINNLLHERLKITAIPFILVTHSDRDHVEGINDVLIAGLKRKKPIKPDYIFINHDGISKLAPNVPEPKRRKFYKIFKKLNYLVQTHELNVKCMLAEDETARLFEDILNRYGLGGTILYPDPDQLNDIHRTQNWNLASILMKLCFGKASILYAADLPDDGWEQVPEKETLKADVFKVPHHGAEIAETGSGEKTTAQMDHIAPRIALVSVGSDNMYGHPLPEVIEAIAAHPSQPHVFCTQMTDRCSIYRESRFEKVAAFYNKHLNENDWANVSTPNCQNFNVIWFDGTACAGTIRIIINKHAQYFHSTPSILQHTLMLKTFFNSDPLLCGVQHLNTRIDRS
ncbi:MAG: ComEC/Rec2 family competence protein [Candidatus Omnitrophota bacterium]